MAQNIVQVLGKCIYKKAFWCCLIVAATCVLLFYQHSYRTCAAMLVFVMVGVLSIVEEYHEPADEASIGGADPR